MSYSQLAKDILKNVGGEENVNSVIHCATRLRFKLKDDSIAKTDAIKNLDGVIQVVQSGGQYQVVIGNTVRDVHEELTSIISTKDKETDEKKGNLLNRAIDVISGIFLPFLGVMAGAGVLKGILALLVTLGWANPESGTYQIMLYAADAFFQYLPLAIAYTAAKKFKTDPFIALATAAALIYPGVGQTPLSFLGINVVLPLAGYMGSVLPVIIIVAVQAPVEKFFKKVIPSYLRTVVPAMLTLVVMVPLSFVVLGPLGAIIGDSLGAVYTSIFETSPILAGLIIGAFWQVLVMFGMHWGFVPITITNLSLYGYDSFTPMLLPAVISQAGSALAVMIKTKDAKQKQLASSGVITAIFGITEPTVYGTTLPLKTPFIAGCIGGAIGSMITAISGVKAFSQVMPSLLAIPAFISNTNDVSSNVLGAILGSLAAFIIAFVLTLMMKFDTKEETQTVNDNEESVKNIEVKKDIITSPLQGSVLTISNVDDKVFSSEAMGKGVAIIPSIGELRAPFDGTVVTLFPTGHAVGMMSDNGTELLMHIGLDTVSLEESYYVKHVSQGQRVSQGDLLISFDIEGLKNEGKSLVSPLVVTNTQEFLDVLVLEHEDVVFEEDLIVTVK